MQEEQFEFSAAYEKVQHLLWKHLNNEPFSVEEQQYLDEWLAQSTENQQLFTDLTHEPTLHRELAKYHAAEKEKEAARQQAEATVFQEAPVIKMKRRQGLQIAAAILLLMTISTGTYYFYFRTNKKEVTKTAHTPGNDLPPGKDKAILILADGQQIILDNAQSGILTQQGNTQVVNDSGSLKYEIGPSTSLRTKNEVAFNTVSTPKGGQYQIVLADGSKVWLNAASLIKFPTEFVGEERKVEITGEAYFEVAPSTPPSPKREGASKQEAEKRTFIVSVNSPSHQGALIEVLGTHFNVNAYSDEDAIKTTLLEGKVKVVNGESSMVNGKSVLSKAKGLAILTPGQQALIFRESDKSSQILVQTNANVEQAVAWKNGYFYFTRADIKTVLRQLERWYDLEIVYEGPPPHDTFSGKMQRNLPLSKVLKYLEKSEIRFRIEGRKLIIGNRQS